MVQAARSGVQNIAEGSIASGTSKKTELKLTNVARASLEELKLDYEDFLRHRNLKLWVQEDIRRQNLIDSKPTNVEDLVNWIKRIHESGHYRHSGQCGQNKAEEKLTFPEITANTILVLITVAISLLGRQLSAQADAFKSNGGFTERLYNIRKKIWL